MKNVNIFTGSDFNVKSGQINIVVDDSEITEFYPIYMLNDWTHHFTDYTIGDFPLIQPFECEIKINSNSLYLIFAKQGYKIKAFDLKIFIDEITQQD
ncbi:MAG: hypothetical protein LUH15_07660 [Tannerellaceae bacterium]|nr:hypothetical protein [Tannerellaceae bacterium]